MAASDVRAVPRATPETAHFWNGLKEGRILLQRCQACERSYFPPRNFCPHCGGGEVEIQQASGDASLHAFVISNHRVPGFERPYVVAIAELPEGVRLMTQLVDAEPDPSKLQIDMALEPVFHRLDEDVTLLHFRPRGEA